MIVLRTIAPGVRVVVEAPWSDNYVFAYIEVDQLKVVTSCLFFGKQSIDCTHGELEEMSDALADLVIGWDGSELDFKILLGKVREWSLRSTTASEFHVNIFWRFFRHFVRNQVIGAVLSPTSLKN